MRKAAGNAVELGSIVAFGFSPLWLLAAAADVTRGTRVYLDDARRRAQAGRRARGGRAFGSVDDLLGALRAVGGAARLIDIPPLESRRLRSRSSTSRGRARASRAPADLASLYDGLRADAARERRSLLEVSTGIGLAFFNSARLVGRQHVLEPYKNDLRPLRDEGFGAYAARVSRPYAEAVARHFDPERRTLTERGISRARGET